MDNSPNWAEALTAIAAVGGFILTVVIAWQARIAATHAFGQLRTMEQQIEQAERSRRQDAENFRAEQQERMATFTTLTKSRAQMAAAMVQAKGLYSDTTFAHERSGGSVFDSTDDLKKRLEDLGIRCDDPALVSRIASMVRDCGPLLTTVRPLKMVDDLRKNLFAKQAMIDWQNAMHDHVDDLAKTYGFLASEDDRSKPRAVPVPPI